MKRIKILAALAAALAATFAATAAPAGAAVSSASIDGATATLNLDGADDNVTVSVSGGLLVHGQTTGGLNSGSDWDSATAGDQTVPADGTFVVVVNGGDGNDSLTVLAKNSEIVTAALNGGGGDDVLTGADTGDSLEGGDGNDRLVGAKGGDDMNGGAGNDTLVWNNGDGTRLDRRRRRQRRHRGQRQPDARRRVHARAERGPDQVPADEPGAVHARRLDRALPGQRPRRRRLRHGRATAWARSRCCRSTAAPVRTRSTAPTGRT